MGNSGYTMAATLVRSAPPIRIRYVIEEKSLDIERKLSHQDILGYLRSWSGYTKYCEHHGVVEGSKEDPIVPIDVFLADQAEYIDVVYPIRLLLSVKTQ